ncbi:MAG: hypothetical protein HY711_02655 [Candidatus Melainabacteria bacterium]|nr:hypothetical protein [Candidatus Melainabacteria bacterium]
MGDRDSGKPGDKAVTGPEADPKGLQFDVLQGFQTCNTADFISAGDPSANPDIQAMLQEPTIADSGTVKIPKTEMPDNSIYTKMQVWRNDIVVSGMADQARENPQPTDAEKATQDNLANTYASLDGYKQFPSPERDVLIWQELESKIQDQAKSQAGLSPGQMKEWKDEVNKFLKHEFPESNVEVRYDPKTGKLEPHMHGEKSARSASEDAPERQQSIKPAESSDEGTPSSRAESGLDIAARRAEADFARQIGEQIQPSDTGGKLKGPVMKHMMTHLFQLHREGKEEQAQVCIRMLNEQLEQKHVGATITGIQPSRLGGGEMTVQQASGKVTTFQYSGRGEVSEKKT